MSVQWFLIASFLYLEIAVVSLLLLPFISPQRWHRFLKSRLIRNLVEYVNFYFYAALSILALCLIDSIRTMRKYGGNNGGEAKAHHRLEQDMRDSMSLLRAQRNFFIVGFSIFLVFVIRRLITLISTQAVLMANSEAALKQAKSATAAARLVKFSSDKKEEQGEQASHSQDMLKKLEEELEIAKKERCVALKDLEAIKSQSEGTNREYDRLVEEHNKLLGKLAILEGGELNSVKKTD